MSRRSLVYLYPRAWRKRYGQEFVLLLEASPLSAATLMNVVIAAGRQRLMHTALGALLLGPAVTYGAWHAAQYLNSVIEVAPTLIGEQGPPLIVPPWPVYLGAISLGWLAAAFYRSGLLRSRPDAVARVSEPELLGWLATLLLHPP